MSFVTSPNMSMPVPTVGSENGPTYAFDINASLTIIDSHDHSAGKGVQITPAGINVNSSLAMNGNFLISSAGMTMTAQVVTPANNTVYESGTDLYFVDGLGNNVRITQSGGVAGSPGSISGLVAPASASYVPASQTFVWQSNTNVSANMDAASIIIRYQSASAHGITISSPNALAADYTLTLPSALPASQKIMTLDSTGAISAPYTVDGTTIAIASNIIGVPAGGIGTTQLAASAVTGAKIAASTITFANIAASTIQGSNIASATITGTNLQSNLSLGGIPTIAGTNPIAAALGANYGYGMKIAWAIIQSGVIAGGSGISSYNVGTGAVTYTSTFANTPAPMVTALFPNATTTPSVRALSASSCLVVDASGTPGVTDFTIMVVGAL